MFQVGSRSDAISSPTQIPICAVVNIEITCSNACRNARILSIEISFSLMKSGKLVDFIKTKKIWGVSGTLSGRAVLLHLKIQITKNGKWLVFAIKSQFNSIQFYSHFYKIFTLILCSKTLRNVIRNLSLSILLPRQHTGFQTPPILKAFLATFGISYLQMVPHIHDPASI